MALDFSTIHLEALRPLSQTLIALSSKDDVHAALKKLSESKVHSAPVVDEKGTVLGLFDYCDVVSYLVTNLYGSLGVTGGKPDTLESLAAKTLHGTDLDPTNGVLQKFFQTPAKELINYSGQNPLKTLPQNSTFADLINALAGGMRRVIVVDKDGKVVNLIAQSTVVTFLSKNIAKFEPLVNKTLEELGVGKKSVITVSAKTRAFDAFARLHESKVSGLGIQDSAGNFSGNVSLKDIESILQEPKRLVLPIEEYINIIRRDDLYTVFPTIGCHLNDTLATVIQKLSAVHKHRMYIKEGETSLVGIVSLSDVIAILAKNQTKK